MRSCFDNLSPSLFSLLRSPLSTYRTCDLPGSPGIGTGTGTKQPSRVYAEPRSKDTRQQRLLVVTGQRWRCHLRHVIPAPRCSDANPYLPRQLFHRRVEGTADMSQPAGNLSAQSTPSIKEHIQSRARLRPAVNIYCCTKSHPSEARFIRIHLSVTLFFIPLPIQKLKSTV